MDVIILVIYGKGWIHIIFNNINKSSVNLDTFHLGCRERLMAIKVNFFRPIKSEL